MDIRKYIRESLEHILREENVISDSENEIVGEDILNYFPFTELPENRTKEYSRVSGWGDIKIPSLDGNGLTTILSKSDVLNYLRDFVDYNGEDPIFILNPLGSWYDKIIIKNNKRKELHNKAVDDFGTKGD
jgi:hypothetical protein